MRHTNGYAAFMRVQADYNGTAADLQDSDYDGGWDSYDAD